MNGSLSSGVGVLDKATLVLNTLEAGPTTLTNLVKTTGLARPTAHRLAVSLEFHRLVTRDEQGRFMLGPRLKELGAVCGEDHLLTASMPILNALRSYVHESVQLFRVQGDSRICVATSEPESGLIDSTPPGALVSMKAGSGAQVLLAWEEPERMYAGLQGAVYTATTLSLVRRRGWAQSIAERQPGVASVSAPVRGINGRVIAALSVSGPIERIGRQPGRHYGPSVVAAANRLSALLRNDGNS